MKIFDFVIAFAKNSKNAFAFDIEILNNSFDWNRFYIVDNVKILNQKVFVLTVMYDAFTKSSFASFIENMKILIAMNMSSFKHFININNFVIEIFDFDIAINVFSKNSSSQHIENSKTSKKNSICIYELFVFFVFDFNINIDFEIYIIDIDAIISFFVLLFKRKLQLLSFRNFVLRHNLFDWNRSRINSIDRHIFAFFLYFYFECCFCFECYFCCFEYRFL